MPAEASRAEKPHVAVVGAGFTGLAAAWDLARQGIRVSIFERDHEVGGLAGGFRIGDQFLEKFYHHWFTNDIHVMKLIEELGVSDQIVERPTRTGMYYANKIFRLSTPLDVLRFTPLSLVGRIRLGLLVLRARMIRDWRKLESLTAEEWLRGVVGDEVYKIVWEPLLRGKFAPFADQVSAVWFWKKLVLRGGSRGRRGEERLAYYRGGFAALANEIAQRIRDLGGVLYTGEAVTRVDAEDGRVVGVATDRRYVRPDAVILTPALPIIADLIGDHLPEAEAAKLRAVDYLGNLCLVLQLKRSLSSTYWLNVTDPSFPYVGIIEHTNFEPPESYLGRHIVYLSKYLPQESELFTAEDDQILEISMPHIQRMFPAFRRDWIVRYDVWRASYAQPIIVRDYSELLPPLKPSLQGTYIATMAQIYPEDRGTNYAIRQGRHAAAVVVRNLREIR